MKCFVLALAALLVLLAGFALAGNGWFAANQPAPVVQTRAECQDHSQASFHSPAALRWRQCQPNHWRTCMLQR